MKAMRNDGTGHAFTEGYLGGDVFGISRVDIKDTSSIRGVQHISESNKNDNRTVRHSLIRYETGTTFLKKVSYILLSIT